VNIVAAEVDLEPTDACQGSGGGSDLRREVRQRAQVVSGNGGGAGKARSRELHSVTGIARESDGYGIKGLFLLMGRVPPPVPVNWQIAHLFDFPLGAE
jgi:hypothetical protein